MAKCASLDSAGICHKALALAARSHSFGMATIGICSLLSASMSHEWSHSWGGAAVPKDVNTSIRGRVLVSWFALSFNFTNSKIMHISTLQQFCLLPALVAAWPFRHIQTRQDNGTSFSLYSLPASVSDGSSLRAAGISAKQTSWTYGPGIGGGPFSPAGSLGTAAIARDATVYKREGGDQLVLTLADNASATADIDQVRELL